MRATSAIPSGVLAATVLASAAPALEPLPACYGPENGMHIWSAEPFGHEESGFTLESYTVLPNENGYVVDAKGPIPQLDNFQGVRITDCRSMRFLAIASGNFEEVNTGAFLATEFLRPKVQAKRKFSLSDVERAAKAVYRGSSKAKVLKLRETERTCACREFFPAMQ